MGEKECGSGRGVEGIMVCLWSEKGCWGHNGVFRAQRGVLR